MSFQASVSSPLADAPSPQAYGRVEVAVQFICHSCAVTPLLT